MLIEEWDEGKHIKRDIKYNNKRFKTLSMLYQLEHSLEGFMGDPTGNWML